MFFFYSGQCAQLSLALYKHLNLFFLSSEGTVHLNQNILKTLTFSIGLEENSQQF